MSQSESLKALDASIFASLSGAGLADQATYTPSSGGAAISCGIFIDRGVTLTGSLGQAINDAIVITAFAAEIGAPPQHGARFQVGTETFTVDALSNKDESRYVCVVKPGI